MIMKNILKLIKRIFIIYNFLDLHFTLSICYVLILAMNKVIYNYPDLLTFFHILQ